MMSRDNEVVYGTPININMHTARKKKGIIDTLYFGVLRDVRRMECKYNSLTLRSIGESY